MYLPWPGLFDRIQQSDVFVLLDNVAYSKNYFINRNRIKTANGPVWLTVPVLTKGEFGKPINEVKADNSEKWQARHWRSIQYSYSKAEYFSGYSAFFEDFYNSEPLELLVENIRGPFNFLIKALGITTKIVKASELKAEGKKDKLLLNICKELGADEYISGPSGKDYLKLDKWKEAGIEVSFHDYNHPTYPQLHGEFLPNMSVIDLLFNCGPKSLKILSKNQLDGKKPCVLYSGGRRL